MRERPRGRRGVHTDVTRRACVQPEDFCPLPPSPATQPTLSETMCAMISRMRAVCRGLMCTGPCRTTPLGWRALAGWLVCICAQRKRRSLFLPWMTSIFMRQASLSVPNDWGRRRRRAEGHVRRRRWRWRWRW